MTIGEYLRDLWARVRAFWRLAERVESLEALVDARSRVVTARGFFLTDREGRYRGGLHACSDDGSPSLALCDARGAVRISQRLSADGSPVVKLFDANGKSRIVLMLETRESPDEPIIAVRNAEGTPRVVLTEAVVGMYDKSGSPRLALSVLRDDGTPGFGILDEKGGARATLSVDTCGKVRLELMDEDGRQVFEAPAKEPARPEGNGSSPSGG